MSADDQQFLDILSAVPNDVRRYTNEIADAIDRHLDRVSVSLRDHMPNSWLRRPSSQPLSSPATYEPTLYNSIHVFAKKNRKILIGVAVFLGLSTYLVYRNRKAYGRKRRAKRASNGARTEVVLIAGSPNEPITRSLSLDLERRGFIVYVVCSTIEEELLVQNEGRADIKPLIFGLSDPESTQASLDRFSLFFSTPQHAFSGAKAHHLTLSSLIVIPSANYPTAPISSVCLSPSVWADLLNTRVLYPILIIHSFLPLLRNLYQTQNSHSSIITISNSIISSLQAPLHAPESVSVTSFETFTSILKEELSSSCVPIPVINIKLGYFDLSSLVPHYHQQVATNNNTKNARGNFMKPPTGKSSPLRELHNAVFDTIESSSNRSKWALWRQSDIVRVGQGSTMYSLAGKVFPRGLIGWMIGLKSVVRGDGQDDEYVRVNS